MIGFQHTLLFAISWQWVLDVFNDQQRMIQIGAVIAVAAIFLLTRANK